MTAPKKGKGDDPLDALNELEKFDEQFRPGDATPADRGGAGAPGNLDQKYRDVLEISALLSSTLDLTDLLNNILDGVLKVADLMLRGIE